MAEAKRQRETGAIEPEAFAEVLLRMARQAKVTRLLYEKLAEELSQSDSES